MEQVAVTPNSAKYKPVIPKFFFFFPVDKSYAYTCGFCFSVGKGVELFCCFDIFQSLQTFIFLIVLGSIGQHQDDPRVIFRVVQVICAIPACLALYGIEKDQLKLIVFYYYVKLFELLMILIRYFIMFIAGECTEDVLLNYVKGYCFTEIDAFLFVVYVVLTLYEAFLLFSYVNLVTLGEKSKAMRDEGLARGNSLPIVQNTEKVDVSVGYNNMALPQINEVKQENLYSPQN